MFIARVIRTSSLRNISLRHNRINATGAVALALMIRDYPDVVPSTPNSATFPTHPGSAISPPPSPMPQNTYLPPPSPVTRTGPVLPPPRHPSSLPPQTTYTPYVPRRRGAAFAQPPPLSASGQPVPIITSNPQGGVTTRHPPPHIPHRSESEHHPNGTNHKHDDGPSAALLDKVRALDALPRIGALRTLDLRGNDLRVSALLEYRFTSNDVGIEWSHLSSASAQTEQDAQGSEFKREQAGCSVLSVDCRGAGKHSYPFDRSPVGKQFYRNTIFA
jgi:protein phosphatase 1 regulatory subunit 37